MDNTHNNNSSSNYPADRKFLIRGIPANKVKEVLEYIQEHMGGIPTTSMHRDPTTVEKLSSRAENGSVVAFGIKGPGQEVGPYFSLFSLGAQWSDVPHIELQYSPGVFTVDDPPPWGYNDG
jgi:hypothetical protein